MPGPRSGQCRLDQAGAGSLRRRRGQRVRTRRARRNTLSAALRKHEGPHRSAGLGKRAVQDCVSKGNIVPHAGRNQERVYLLAGVVTKSTNPVTMRRETKDDDRPGFAAGTQAELRNGCRAGQGNGRSGTIRTAIGSRHASRPTVVTVTTPVALAARPGASLSSGHPQTEERRDAKGGRTAAGRGGPAGAGALAVPGAPGAAWKAGGRVRGAGAATVAARTWFPHYRFGRRSGSRSQHPELRR